MTVSRWCVWCGAPSPVGVMEHGVTVYHLASWRTKQKLASRVSK